MEGRSPSRARQDMDMHTNGAESRSGFHHTADDVDMAGEFENFLGEGKWQMCKARTRAVHVLRNEESRAVHVPISERTRGSDSDPRDGHMYRGSDSERSSRRPSAKGTPQRVSYPQSTTIERAKSKSLTGQSTPKRFPSSENTPSKPHTHSSSISAQSTPRGAPSSRSTSHKQQEYSTNAPHVSNMAPSEHLSRDSVTREHTSSTASSFRRSVHVHPTQGLHTTKPPHVQKSLHAHSPTQVQKRAHSLSLTRGHSSAQAQNSTPHTRRTTTVSQSNTQSIHTRAHSSREAGRFRTEVPINTSNARAGLYTQTPRSRTEQWDDDTRSEYEKVLADIARETEGMGA